jgi:hypothetical protein
MIIKSNYVNNQRNYWNRKNIGNSKRWNDSGKHIFKTKLKKKSWKL